MEKVPIDILWVLLATGLVFMMQAGFLCLESGLTRAKNSINVAIKNLTDFGVAVIFYWCFGFALMFGMTKGGLFGTTHFFTDIQHGGTWLPTFFLFQVMFCATAATIVSGAIAERVKFASYIVITMVISGLIYPIFGHWAWGGAYEGAAGWLAARGFVDFAGSTVVHSVGGWVALALLIIMGPRTGRFPENESPREIQGNDIPLAMLGVLLLFFGWFGFNGGSTLSFNEQVPKIIFNTTLAGSAGLVVNLVIGWVIKKAAHVSLPMNGALAGLVAITANCHAVNAISALIIGAIGGLIALGVTYLLERWQIDDVIGAVPVHAASGVWGTLAVALFGDLELLGTGLTRTAQFQVQSLGVLVCFFVAFGLTYVIFLLINRIWPIRCSLQDEIDGLNVVEHGATTEILDLLTVMSKQAETKDLNLRVPEEPFTEVGQIARQYNRVMSALNQSQTMLVQAEKLSAIGVLGAGIAHELNNPMMGIMNFIQYCLKHTPENDKRYEVLQDAEVQTKRCSDIVKNLLTFSHMDQEGEEGKSEESIEEIIDQVQRLLTYRIEKENVSFQLNVSKNTPKVWIKSNAMQQVFLNLITNALDALQGCDQKEILFDIYPEEDNLHIFVKDSGCGIASDQLKKIYDPFFTTKPPGKGTGLGLSVCVNIVKMHNGKFDCESQPGRGTTFHIELPLDQRKKERGG